VDGHRTAWAVSLRLKARWRNEGLSQELKIAPPGLLAINLGHSSRGPRRQRGKRDPESDYINQMSQDESGAGANAHSDRELVADVLGKDRKAAAEFVESGAGANPHSDRELVADVLAKDRKATAEFVARYADHVYGYVRRRLIPHIDLVDDLVQEIFLAAWDNLDKFKGDCPLGNWLVGICPS
jgi:Sigma-70 region 2